MAGLGQSFDEDAIIADINVTPLVDIALVLLIIFIVTSSILVKAAINADLPSAASAEEVLPDSVSVVLDRTGALFLDGDPVTPEQLATRLRAEIQENPEARALIAADGGLVYERVVEIIDMVRLAGFSGFSLNVERANPDAVETE